MSVSLPIALKVLHFAAAPVMYEGIAWLGSHNPPLVTMTGVAMQVSIQAWESGGYPTIRATHARDIDSLKAAGADLFSYPVADS
jgi:hypothetical protein